MSVERVLPLRVLEQTPDGLRSVNIGNSNANDGQTPNLNIVQSLDKNIKKSIDNNDLDVSETPKLRPKRSVAVPSFYFEDDVDEHEKMGSSKKPKKDVVGKIKVNIRRNEYDLPPPDENTCKISNDMRDCCKTLCKVCDKPYGLTQMRSHTLSKHKLQITKYKEIHGPFVIIDVVYHKCKICGKLVLLDSDFLGAHIKNTHKMKERDYSDQYLIRIPKLKEAKNNDKSEKKVVGKVSAKKLKSAKPKNKLKKKSKLNKMLSFEFDFNDFEYDCNLKDCEMCGRAVAVDLNESKVKVDQKLSKPLDVGGAKDCREDLNADKGEQSASQDTSDPGQDTSNAPVEDDHSVAKEEDGVDPVEDAFINSIFKDHHDMDFDEVLSQFSDEEMEVDEDFDTSKEDLSDSNETLVESEDSLSDNEEQECGSEPDDEIIIKSENVAINNINENENSTEEEITLDSDDFNLSSASDSETLAREFKMTQKEEGSLKFTITVNNVNR